MKIKKTIVLALLLLSTFFISAQVKLSQIIQESPIIQSDSNKLYFVDFWATWCGPCKYAKKALTKLQKQYPRDFYALSISEENPKTVEKFIQKYPTELTIAIDYYGETFKYFNIKALPEGFLFDADGNKLWEGHPADLKPTMISKFLKRKKTRKSLREFVQIIDETTNSETEYIPLKELEISRIENENSDLEIYDTSEYVKFNGRLSEILSHLSKIYSGQIDLAAGLDKSYQLYIKKPLSPEVDYKLRVIEELDLEVEERNFTGNALMLKIINPNFWDIHQIDWQGGTENYLINDTDIIANDVNLKDLSYKLSKLLDTSVVISFDNSFDIESLHDWQIHYKFFQLMENNFSDYGIKVEQIETGLVKYHIMKKAP